MERMLTCVFLQKSYALGDGTRTVDMYLEWPTGSLIIEVDGPLHYMPTAQGLRSEGSTPTRMRNYILQNVWGYKLLCIYIEAHELTTFDTDHFKEALACQLVARGVPLRSVKKLGIDGSGLQIAHNGVTVVPA